MNTSTRMDALEGKKMAIYLEFPDLYDLAVAAVSFANLAGGEMVIGVNPATHEIFGLSDDEISKALSDIPHAIEKLCMPAIVPEIFVRNVDDRHLLIVKIGMGFMKPYYIRDEGDREGVYIRQAKVNRRASKMQIEEMIRESRNQSFDEILVKDYHLDDIHLSALKDDVHQLIHMEVSDSDLLRLGLFDRLIPSRALAIIAGDENRFGYAKILCTKHRITASGNFEDETEEMQGSLPRRVIEAIDFLLNDTSYCSYRIPRQLLLEAIVNAVTHRDYAMTEHAIQIESYPDRLVIASPGGLMKTMTITKILSGMSEARNPLISNFMRYIGFSGSWGTGIRRIQEICIEEGIYTPTFVEEGIFFKVIFDMCGK